jgi:hypothetical protein
MKKHNLRCDLFFYTYFDLKIENVFLMKNLKMMTALAQIQGRFDRRFGDRRNSRRQTKLTIIYEIEFKTFSESENKIQ